MPTRRTDTTGRSQTPNPTATPSCARTGGVPGLPPANCHNSTPDVWFAHNSQRNREKGGAEGEVSSRRDRESSETGWTRMRTQEPAALRHARAAEAAVGCRRRATAPHRAHEWREPRVGSPPGQQQSVALNPSGSRGEIQPAGRGSVRARANNHTAACLLVSARVRSHTFFVWAGFLQWIRVHTP